MSIIENVLKGIKNFRTFIWIFTIVMIFVIIFYPIIDANFLYYSRINNRIEILNKVSNLDYSKMENDEVLVNEYNSILKEMATKEDKYLNNIFIKNESKRNSVIKVVSFSWLFILFFIIYIFTKDDKTGKYIFCLNKIGGFIIILLLGVIFGWIGYIIPTVINVVVNVVLYQLFYILIFYSLYTSGLLKSSN